MSLAIERLKKGVESTLTKEKALAKDRLSLIEERYKYINDKLVDEPLNRVALEYYMDLVEGGDQESIINSFIAGALYHAWVTAVNKQKEQ